MILLKKFVYILNRSMKNVIYFLLLSVIAGSCGNEENPPEPEQQVVKCEPEKPALYGTLSGMQLIVREVNFGRFVLQSTTENREGLEFAEPRLISFLPDLFSTCNIPQNFLKNGLILKISGEGYIEDDLMRRAKVIYFDNSESTWRNSSLIFLDYTDIEAVPQ